MAFIYWDIILFIILLFTIIYIYIMKTLNALNKKGIVSLPAYPFVGNMGDVIKRKENFNIVINKAYSTFPDHKYIGFYRFHEPFVIIKDIELLKQIAIKDFDYFQDHQNIVDERADPLFGKNLFSISGKKWRDMRATLSPAFTSFKMRNMFLLVNECGERLTDYYLKKIDENSNQTLEIEMKDTFTRYTNDVIATAAFGIEVDSLNNPNNEFYIMGKEATAFTVYRMLKLLFFMIAPRLVKFFGLTLFGTKLQNFFRNLVSFQMKHRETNNVIRQDMIYLLMEAKKGSLKHEITDNVDKEFATVQESDLGNKTSNIKWTDDDITAQVILFFFAGFETSSTALSFLVHELAMNKNIQLRLQNEISEVYKNNNGKLYYDDLQKMKYLDMVVSELLRKWPAGSLTDRKCLKPYTLPPSNSYSKQVHLNPNDGIWIPIYSIHNDPKYYRNPEIFDPERFSDENKINIKPFTYIPFGIGPRNCIGSRFALMEIKSVIFHLLVKFDFVPITKTQNPLILNKKIFNLSSESGFWIGLKKRNSNI